MQGLELCRSYFREYGLPMLQENFPELLPLCDVALIGSGSECFGYDDEVSQDHDFEPGFQIFLPGEDVVDRKTAFALERAYAKLPREYLGFSRTPLSPVGADRRGVLRLSEYLQSHLGVPDGNLTPEDFLRLPESYLFEMTRGEIFHEGLGELSRVRNALARMPADVRLCRLSGHLLLCAQSGQYNFTRCLEHNEYGAAALAKDEFCDHALSCAFLLGRAYRPYYKWCFRALREVPGKSDLANRLQALLCAATTPENAFDLYMEMEEVASMLIADLQDQGLTEAICADLEKHAYSVRDHIRDPQWRNRNILFAVQSR